MWVRDHQRPLFHKALGVDVTWYGQEVFRKTSEITKQVFPITLDIDHPRWRPNLDRMEAASRQIAAAKERGGIGGFFSRMTGMAKAASAFVAVFTIPSHKHTVPDSPRLEPAY
jgi:magnesium-protoporphyrin IX monomethyl ester (oxidative) cyclase